MPCASRRLNQSEKNYPAFLLEMAAGVFGMCQFDVYLRGRKFVWHSDHKPLLHLNSVQHKTLNRLSEKLLEYDFVIEYCPGEIMPSDFLSRKTTETCASVRIMDDDLAKLSLAQKRDPAVQKFKDKVGFVCRNGIVCKKVHSQGSEKIVYVLPSAWTAQILRSYHSSLVGGHSGVFKTIRKIQEVYWWPRLREDVEKFIKECWTCQKAKLGPPRRPAPLTPIQPPLGPNDRVHIDLHGPLLPDQGMKYVLVITCAFSKVIELVALPNKEPYTVAQGLLKWISHYGLPNVLVHDRGREWHNTMWRDLCKFLKIDQHFASPYHPHSSGQVEVINRIMDNYLRSFLQDTDTREWVQLLPAMMLHYNTSVQSSTGSSPLSTVLGYNVRVPGTLPTPFYREDDAGALMQKLQLARMKLHRVLQQQTKVQQSKYNKQYAATHPLLRVGQLVMQRRTAYPLGRNKKFISKYTGPYKITQQIGPFTYLIENCLTSKTYSSHADLLKPYHGIARPDLVSPSPDFIVPKTLPPQKADQDWLVVPPTENDPEGAPDQESVEEAHVRAHC